MNPTFIDSKARGPYNDYGLEPVVTFDVQNITIGPKGIRDTSELLNNKYWATYFDPATSNIILEEYNPNSTTVILNEPAGVLKIGLAFDQTANDVYAYILTNGDLKLRWFDASINDDAIIDLGKAVDVAISMDTNYYPSSLNSDVLVFYIRGGAIFYRIQRDKYAIEYTTTVTNGAREFESIGTRRDYRFQVSYK